MDEPTSALSNHEVDVLFSVMADLRQLDVTIIYISHKLDEFRRIGDYVTVFRDGKLVATELMAKTDTAWIVRQMVGRDPNTLFARAEGTPGEVILKVSNLTAPGAVRPVVRDVSFTVRAGEVVGIYGLMGAGRTELMECLIGSRATIGGEVVINGTVESKATVRSRMKAGLALVPEDRQRDGLVQAQSVKDNIVLAILDRLTRLGLLNSAAPTKAAAGQVESLKIKIPGLGAEVTVAVRGQSAEGRSRPCPAHQPEAPAARRTHPRHRRRREVPDRDDHGRTGSLRVRSAVHLIGTGRSHGHGRPRTGDGQGPDHR